MSLTASKIISFQESLEDRVLLMKTSEVGRRIVFTNGCFDILHSGHVEYLEQARETGSCLVVAVNSDDSVRRLKGPTRPINPAMDRARVLAGLECVDYALIFDDDRVTRLLEIIKPGVWAKGGDYTLEKLDQSEVAMAMKYGAEIKLIPFVGTYSTTATLKRLAVG